MARCLMIGAACPVLSAPCSAGEDSGAVAEKAGCVPVNCVATERWPELRPALLACSALTATLCLLAHIPLQQLEQ